MIFIVSEIDGIDFRRPAAAVSVHFPETGGFNSDVNAFAVFAVKFIDVSAPERHV